LKTYGNGSNGEQEAIRDTAREIRDGCNAHLVKNVRFIQGMVPPHQMPDLYRAADVLVHLPYGEGFGLTVQEAAACGIPAIYSNNTSLPEFAEGWPVLCRPEPVHGRQLSRWYQVVQEWWRPDPLAAVAAFLHVYELWKTNPDEIKRTGRNARLRVQKLHNWKVIGGRLGEIFSDVVRRAVTQITQAAAPELTLVPSAPEQKPIGAGEYTFGSDGGGTPPADPGVLEPATRRASTTSLGAGADVPAIGS
jgi:glycosyltransferase involved in cell wall biosynthesis